MRFVIRYLLSYMRNSLIFETSKTKRELIFSSNEYKSKEKEEITNFISSTVFIGTKLKVGILSFFYGAAVYLSQRIQVWCLAISFVQLFLFHTGKSFWPLLIFTFFIAYMYSMTELKKRKNDIEINGRIVNLKNKKTKTRGEIIPGDIIILKNNEEAPCDLILIDYEKNEKDESKRIIFSMNEAQVTGETKPVRKYLVNGKIDKITIDDLNKTELIVNDKQNIDEKSIAYGNSILNCDDDIKIIGVACWVSRETKALKQPKSPIDYRQPSPFNEYTMKGFLLSLFFMLAISVFNSIVSSIHRPEERAKTNLITILVINIMYLNMMVPQAMEQIRVSVATVLSLSFPEEVKCNNQLVIDILGSVTKIVTDKTGTLTQNKMDPVLLMIHNEKNEKNIFLQKEENIEPFKNEEILHGLLAIFSNTGIEPEEISIRNILKPFAKLIAYEAPDSNEKLSGSIKFQTLDDSKIHNLIIHVNFGFCRSLISKSCLFEYDEKFYIGTQAGGDEFWLNKKINNFNEDFIIKQIGIWDKKMKDLKNLNGALRSWSHGLKEVSIEEKEKIIRLWHESIDKKENREENQKRIIIDSLQGLELKSKILMVDTYRDGVIEGFHKLYSTGKQIFICTGDSVASGITIANQFNLPKNHQIIQGNNKQEILHFLKKSIENDSENEKKTYFFNQEIMNELVKIEKEFGFEDELFEVLFSIFEKKRNKKYSNYGIFCRATPALKPWVVKLMQYKKTSSVFEYFNSKRNYVLSIGDGSNDLNMLTSSDVSLGILSGETKDIVSKSSFWSKEWKPVVNLLLKEGPEKSILISLMVKLVFLKHWMTAFTLWSDLIYNGFPLMPMDPMNPILMLVYNAIVFTQIGAYASSDEVKNVNENSKLMGNRSLLKWIISAGITGFLIDGIVRLFFPNSTTNDFGSLIQVGQAISIVTYLILITNVFKNKKEEYIPKELWFSLFSILTSIFLIKLVLNFNFEYTIYLNTFGLIVIVSSIYSSFTLFKFVNSNLILSIKTFWNFLTQSGDLLLNDFVYWTHTWNGRIIPSLFFTCIVCLYSGTSFVSLLLIAIFVSIFTTLIFFIFISKSGFLNSLFEGKVIAVFIFGFIFGHWYKS
eukprot:gene964-9871_t